jgi:hypothetical protein
MRRKAMKAKHFVALVGMIALLAFATNALAAAGSLKVKLVDGNGATINGTVVAKMGSTVKTCTTAAGTCTLPSLAAGTWTVSAVTPAGKTGGPVSKVAKNDTTITFTVQVK